jgi:transcriptional antiterminator NusG
MSEQDMNVTNDFINFSVEDETSEKKVNAQWYVVHTYSGYENKVKSDIEKAAENDSELRELIQKVIVPIEEVETVEVNKKGEQKKKVSQRKIYPCYVFVKMVHTDRTWFVIRNTTGVTSFVGPGSAPVPLTPEEVRSMGVERVSIEDLGFVAGDKVLVKSGMFTGSIGTVKEINISKRAVIVNLPFAGRETPTTLDFDMVQPLN